MSDESSRDDPSEPAKPGKGDDRALSPAERARKQVEQRHARFEWLAARLRELEGEPSMFGIDANESLSPDELTRRHATRAERLAARLRELGINVDAPGTASDPTNR